MFVIGSSGRCGTQAICQGLDRFSDHTVWHEPEPRLLVEALAKHRGQPYRSEAFDWVMGFFEEQSRGRYGQTFRAPNLLEDVRRAVPETRFLIVVREPLEYVRSAHGMRAFQRGDEWDTTRIMPLHLGGDVEDLPLAEKLAWHWVAINEHLLDFAAAASVPVHVLEDLSVQVREWAPLLGIDISDPAGLDSYLSTKPNSAEVKELPDRTDEDRLREITQPVWERIKELSAN